MNAIEMRGLTKRFGRRLAVDALSLDIERGELFALLGQNGAGKTTAIRMLCGLMAPTSGDALLLGVSVARDAAQVKRRINLSPQETAVAPNLSVRENLELIARIYGALPQEAASRAVRMMERFGLAERAGDRAGKLSGGLMRRLSIAMGLITEPEILFLDEPTLGLDIRARRELWEAVRALRGHVTVVLTTHYLEEAEALADRIGILERGQLRALGTLPQLQAQTGLDTLSDIFLSLTDAVDVEVGA